MRHRFSLRSEPGTALYMEGRKEGDCHVHDWSAADFRARFVSELRRMHGRGGVNVCRACVDRIREAFKERRHV